MATAMLRTAMLGIGAIVAVAACSGDSVAGTYVGSLLVRSEAPDGPNRSDLSVRARVTQSDGSLYEATFSGCSIRFDMSEGRGGLLMSGRCRCPAEPGDAEGEHGVGAHLIEHDADIIEIRVLAADGSAPGCWHEFRGRRDPPP